jgi:hypothetical protein
MTRRRTPAEKKQLEYTKDHVNSAEYPHAFRKSWPRKKAKASRAYRHKIVQLSSKLVTRQEEDFLDEESPEIVRRREVKKWSVAPMGMIVQGRLEDRIRRTAWNFFREPYDSTRHRERFAKFLASQIDGTTENSRRLALLFQAALSGPQGYNSRSGSWGHRRDWLQDFFRDEPDWERRLRAWIASFEDQELTP